MYYDLGFNDWTFEIDKTEGKQIADALCVVRKDYLQTKTKLKLSMDKMNNIYKETTSDVKKLLRGY